MAEHTKHGVHTNRTTKRGGQNALPDDPFRAEADIGMKEMSTEPSSDGRNPAITTGKGASAAGQESFGRP